ncbi:MAG: M2 family metallopeptidase [Chitinophagaceae bacterium]|nr:M2 family metallopeptidase [Oligoflexus sp.]
MMKLPKSILSTLTLALLATAPLAAAPLKDPTAQEAKVFVDLYNKEYLKLSVKGSRSSWVKENFITEDTETISAEDQTELMQYATKAMRDARRFDKVKVDEETRRMLTLIKLGDPAPQDRASLEELTSISSKMSSLYGKKKLCDEWTKKSSFDVSKDGCLDLEELTELLANSTSADDQFKAWKGWHTLGGELEPLYQRFIELTNKGAKQGGYNDMGESWRSGYDMTPAQFETEEERLWTQVKPLYEDLQCYMGHKLESLYPEQKLKNGLLPAHLLGNMWAQDWSNLYPKVEPFKGLATLDITKALVEQKYDAKKMAKLGESFFTSIGFDPLPQTFYERSLFVKPIDREVVCHASAWDVSFSNDVRIKMCILPNDENLITIHHELGHIFYYQSYYKLPVVYQQGANDGFHEAIGDAIALSVNSNYLNQVGLIKNQSKSSDHEKELINLQMKTALSKVAFLPFGYLVDKWRWEVFSGKTNKDQYNKSWWALREKYQGVTAPEARPDNGFDAGAKYHVAANVPYARYFLANILQFQMFKAMCDASGYKGPLAECSLYGQKAAGTKLKAMLALGASKPWPVALKQLTGSDKMDATAILEYFGPLQTWLKSQNKAGQCNWKSK